MPEIGARLGGLSKGTLSIWLKPHPLTPEELHKRRSKNAYASAFARKGVPWDRTMALRPKQESDLYRLTRAHQLTGNQVAKVAETAVMLRLLACGFNVYGSMFDGELTDWLVEVPGTEKVWKIQVKSTRQGKNGTPMCVLRHGFRSNRPKRYAKGEFDFIVGYDLMSDVAYVWSWSDVERLGTTVSASAEARESWAKLRPI